MSLDWKVCYDAWDTSKDEQYNPNTITNPEGPMAVLVKHHGSKACLVEDKFVLLSSES
jgi:hypothetical protein